MALVKVGNAEYVDIICRSLLIFEGNFRGGPNGQVELRYKVPTMTTTTASPDPVKVMQVLDSRVDLLMKIISQLDETVVSDLFIRIINRWLIGRELTDDPFTTLVDLKVIEKLSQEQKSKLLKNSGEIVQVVSSIVVQYAEKLRKSTRPKKFSLVITKGGVSDDEDDDEEDGDGDNEIVGVCLSLISGLFVEAVVEVENKAMLVALIPHIDYIAENTQQFQAQARNCIDLLKSLDTDDSTISENAERSNFKRAVELLQDPLVPIRANGLHLLRQLILSKDSQLPSQQVIINLLLNQLKDEDSFIYLNCIKALEAVADVYGAAVIVPQLLDSYKKSTNDLDERLRNGEVIERIIQRLDKTMLNDTTDQIVITLLDIVTNRNSNKQDDRMRMSAMSLLGVVSELNYLGTVRHIGDCLNSVIGILTFETKTAILCRSAIVLIASIIKGVRSLNDIAVDQNQVRTLMTRLRHVEQTNDDPLVRYHATECLDLVRIKLVQ